MQPKERVLPLWFERSLAFAFVTVVGALAALVSLWLLLVAGVGGGAAFGAVFTYFGLVPTLSVACGLVMAIAGVSRRGRALDPRRVLVAGGVLFVLGLGGLFAPAAVVASWDFDAAAFREAKAQGDGETLERQAHLAVDDEALTGRSEAEVRALLGAPDRITRQGRGGRVLAWRAGEVNDIIGPGDAAFLFVRFDVHRRAVEARFGAFY